MITNGVLGVFPGCVGKGSAVVEDLGACLSVCVQGGSRAEGSDPPIARNMKGDKGWGGRALSDLPQQPTLYNTQDLQRNPGKPRSSKKPPAIFRKHPRVP